MSSCQSLKCAFASYEAAKYAVEHWHYSKCLPAGKTVKIGAWEDSKFIGIVIFAYGANNNLHSWLGTQQTECCELTRVALTHHKSPVTRIVAIAIKMLRKLCPGMRVIVSYADPNQGHIGGIYQAGGWLYLGKTDADRQKFINGKWRNGRMWKAYSSTYGKIARAREFPTRNRCGKLCYCMPLDSELQKSLLARSLPYPKKVSCAGSIDVDATGSQSVEGGSTPTPALNSQGGDHAR